jgi:hypothetical protein
MKQADVKEGETYLTLIGGNLAKVVVMQAVTGFGTKTRFIVRRQEEVRALPKYRTAAALRTL